MLLRFARTFNRIRRPKRIDICINNSFLSRVGGRVQISTIYLHLMWSNGSVHPIVRWSSKFVHLSFSEEIFTDFRSLLHYELNIKLIAIYSRIIKTKSNKTFTINNNLIFFHKSSFENPFNFSA